MHDTPPLVIVVAMSRQTRAIGNKNQLLWHLPEDLKRFKALTLGHPIIMGRNTFESILKILGKPLPGRTTIVLTRDTSYAYEGVLTAQSLEEAIETATSLNPQEIHIGGGAAVYAEALPLVTRLHATLVDDTPEADAYFPAFEAAFSAHQTSPLQEHNGLTYTWVDYTRN